MLPNGQNGFTRALTCGLLWLSVVSSPSVGAAIVFSVVVGSTTIVDGSGLDANAAADIIQFDVAGAEYHGALFDASGTAALLVGFGDDSRTSITLSDVSVELTELSASRTDVYTAFSAIGLTLPPAQYATLVALSGEAPDYNRESVHTRIRGEYDYRLGEGGPRTYQMGEASPQPISLVQPGMSFFGERTRGQPNTPPPFGAILELSGNWMIQDLHHVGTVLFLDEGVIEIRPVLEPALPALLALALACLAILRLTRASRRTVSRSDARSSRPMLSGLTLT